MSKCRCKGVGVCGWVGTKKWTKGGNCEATYSRRSSWVNARVNHNSVWGWGSLESRNSKNFSWFEQERGGDEPFYKREINYA